MSARHTREGPWRSGVLLRLLGVVLALAACGDSGSGQSGSAFVFLSVERFSLDGSTSVASVRSSVAERGRATAVCVTLRNTRKNPTVTGPTELDNVVVQSYTVRLTGLDGRALQDPMTFDTAVLVPAGTASEDDPNITGNSATFGILLVPVQVKNEGAPPAGTTATARVTFRGRDGRGQRVETQGGVAVEFVQGEGDEGDTTCAGGGGNGNANGNGQPPPALQRP